MAETSLLLEVGLGVAVVVAIVGAILWLARSGYFEPDSTNEQSADEREDLAARNQDFNVPVRKRLKAWSTPMKVFVASLVLMALGVAIAAYQVMKTGSPVQQYVTREVRYALVAIVGIAGGVKIKSYMDDQIGHLLVTYERAGRRNLVEKIPYAKARASVRDGAVRVPEVADSRLLGLFWKYRQRGEDRRLRAGEKPLSDVITHLVPSHGDELADGSGYIITTRENGDEVLSGDSLSDLTYASPNSLSDERATQIRELQKRQKAELKGVKATNAELYTQIRKMRKQIKNDEYRDRQELLDDFDRFSQQVKSSVAHVQESTSRDRKDSRENGEKPGVEA
ncbi:hypothetical protein [Halorarius halobius]|uniref:hypothetical protein n=1 Tax=Halorarius halobius TaxID=2962671 RepID=UPI0020CCD280|nr:hypothetical protein [Halorarius halobius]